MTSREDAIYRPAPTLHISRPTAETLQLKTENSSVELSGASANLFESEIMPRLDGARSVKEIAQVVGLRDVSALTDLLFDLKSAGVLLDGLQGETSSSAFLDYVEILGVDRAEAQTRLQDLRVAVIGQGELGQLIHNQLDALPIGKVHQSTTDLSQSAIAKLAQSHEYLISTIGDGFAAVDYRVNRAVHETGASALFCRVGLTKSVVGPLVFPSETACFTCWKMRTTACAEDFAEQMDFDEAAAKRDVPAPYPPSNIGYLAQITAGTAVSELLKSALALGQPLSADKVLEFEPFKAGWSEHSLIRRPDCPVCSKKNFSFQINQTSKN